MQQTPKFYIGYYLHWLEDNSVSRIYGNTSIRGKYLILHKDIKTGHKFSDRREFIIMALQAGEVKIKANH